MYLKSFLKFINIFGKGYKKKFILMFVFSLAMGLFEFLGLALIFPFMLLLSNKDAFSGSKLLKLLFENVTFLNETNIVTVLGFCIIALYLCKNVFMILNIKFQNNTIYSLLSSVYKNALDKILNAEYAISSKYSLGQKYTLLSSASSELVLGFFQKAIVLFTSLLIAFFILTYLFAKFAIPALLTSVFLVTCMFLQNIFFKSRAKLLGERSLAAAKEFQARNTAVLTGLKEIKIAKKEEFFTENASRAYAASSWCQRNSSSCGMYPLYLTEIWIVLAFVILSMSILHFSASDSSYLVSSLIVVGAVIVRLVPLLNKVQTSLYSINAAFPSVKWFFSSYDELANNQALRVPNCKPAEFKNSIEFQDVCFSYDGKKNILKNINLKINKGEFVGIIGSSGAGKSTLIDVLSGLYSPNSGSVYLDSNEISSSNVDSFQKIISILPQEFSLLPDTIANNVAYGVYPEQIDKDRVVQALSQAHVYDEVVDIQAKVDFSVGQRHRIALARAFYSDFELLIVDEATASLDVATEDLVSNVISSLRGKKTVIAIAHRLNTLKKCDKLIYMNNGEIVDVGSFSELSQRHSDFENMIKLSSFEPS